MWPLRFRPHHHNNQDQTNLAFLTVMTCAMFAMQNHLDGNIFSFVICAPYGQFKRDYEITLQKYDRVDPLRSKIVFLEENDHT